MTALYCDVAECDRPVAGHGQDKCSTHLKQMQRHGKTSPINEKLTPEERCIAIGSEMLEADSDEEFASRRRAFLLACKALGEKAAGRMADLGALANELRQRRSTEVKNGLAGARARGVRLGRPQRVSDEELQRLFELLKTGAAVARVLKMHPASVNERLLRLYGKRRFSSSDTPAVGPRPA